jgi:hypothetical protein
VNHDTGVDTQALLTGDSNEELRMQPRLEEKAQNAKEGKAPRVNINDIRPSQKNSREDRDDLLIVPERQGSGSERRQSIPMKSPSFAKFDPKLKKDLMKSEQERQEKAKRDQ